MKKFEGMLFCTDLDGTLLDDKKAVSKQNLEAIEYFKAQGGLFTFISGRVPMTARNICEIIRPNAPFGCINGAGIYDGVQNKFLWHLEMSPAVPQLAAAVEAQLPDIGIKFYTEQGAYFPRDNEAMVQFRAVTGLPYAYGDFETVKEPVLKVVFGHQDEERIEALMRFLSAHPLSKEFSFTRSERTFYEMLPRGVSKGVAFLKLLEIVGIDPSNTVAVGDYHNDIPMLQSAGRAIAVANAASEVKAVADSVTVGNNDSAIARIIEELDKTR